MCHSPRFSPSLPLRSHHGSVGRAALGRSRPRTGKDDATDAKRERPHGPGGRTPNPGGSEGDGNTTDDPPAMGHPAMVGLVCFFGGPSRVVRRSSGRPADAASPLTRRTRVAAFVAPLAASVRLRLRPAITCRKLWGSSGTDPPRHLTKGDAR